MKARKWLKRAGLGIFGLAGFLLITGFIYERIARSSTLARLTPPGELIDVGGHRLHFVKKGEGGPTVIFESGLDGGGHLPWFKVQDKVARLTTTVAYDRAGIMWSERGNNPKTGKAIADELAGLLKNGNFPKPYVLVGHSLAGLTLKSFVTAYPDDVAGIVLVDASHSEQMMRLPEELKAMMEPPPEKLVRFANAVGAMRLLMKTFSYAGTASSDPINTLSRAYFFKSLDAVVEEMDGVDPLLQETMEMTSLGSIPLAVITGAAPDRFNMVPDEAVQKQIFDVWDDLQADLMNLSTEGERFVSVKSGHYVQLDDPEIVVTAIEKIIAKSRPASDDADTVTPPVPEVGSVEE